MRRGPLLVVALLAFGAGVAGLALLARVPAGPRSVVLVTIDTLRADHVGAYGRSPSPTPRLDALAARGAVVEQAWTSAPLTVPAHATLLTGRLPPQHGLRTNRPALRLAPDVASRGWPTLAESLREAGCRTGAFVSASVLRRDQTGLDAGFDVYDEVDPARPGALEETERRGEDTVARALDWVRAADGAFFLWVHLFDPHAPYDAPAPYGAGAGHAADAEGYEAEVRYADACVGRLLDGLAGREDLVVAVVSDHGEGLGEHGEATHGLLLHEATLRVPLVLVCEGAVAPGTRVRDPRSVRDLPATLLALARVAPPEGMPGAPLLGPRAPAAASLYAETLYGHEQYAWAQAFALRAGAWKLVDAGSELREAELDADPAERAERVFPPGAAPTRPADAPDLADVLSRLRAIAASVPARGGETAVSVEGGGYWSGGASSGAVLPEEENRRLPSPYARIGDHATLGAGQSLVRAGRPAEALERFDAVAAADPANPQAPWWRGQALARLGKAAEAAGAFRQAFDLGARSAETVELATKAALGAALAAAAPDAGALREADRFLESARARGVPETGILACLDATLAHLLGDRARASAALERARRFPREPRLDKALGETESLVSAPR